MNGTESCARPVRLAAALFALAQLCAGSQFTVVVRAPGGWQIQPAERVLIGGKDKVRTGSPGKGELTAEEYKRQRAEPLAQAGLMRWHAAGYLVRKGAGGWAPVAPDGASFKGNTTYAALWSSLKVTAQKDRNSKNTAEFAGGTVYAILAGPDPGESVAALLLDPSNFQGTGEKDAGAAFEERMGVLVGLAGTVKGPAGAKLQGMLLEAMTAASKRLETGIAHYSDLEEGLRFAAVSEKAYASDQAQKSARDALRQTKAWLDRRTAILRALHAGEQWDNFIDKYSDFERFDNSFDELRKMRENAFRESAYSHLSEAKRLRAGKELTAALNEVTIAVSRVPNDKQALDLLETLRIEERRPVGKPVKVVDPTSPEQVRITRYLAFAERSIADGKFAVAEDEIVRADALDKDAPRILLVKAKLHKARQELLKALQVLDAYDRRVNTEDQITAGETLRGQIQYELTTTTSTLKSGMTKAEAEGDYATALARVQDGLKLDPSDPDFLFHGGQIYAVFRKGKEAADLLNQYLQLSQVPGGETGNREKAYQLLPVVNAPAKVSQGTAHWFSGAGMAPGTMYCPVSLAPVAHAAEVRGSKKQITTYTWNGGALESVHTVSVGTGEADSWVYFDYFPDRKMVRRVGTAKFEDKDVSLPRLAEGGTAGDGKGVYVAHLNHPAFDPAMVQRITGKRVATIVAGNPYFHPFVWKGVYKFVAEYDEEGRVKSAVEAGQTSGAPKRFTFQWSGPRLTEIAEQSGSGVPYRRTIAYAGGRIAQETISFQGKTYKIEYKYKNDRLVEAECGEDPSIDGRSRRVTFLQ